MLLNDKIDVIFCYIPQVSIILPKKLLYQIIPMNNLAIIRRNLFLDL